MYTIRPYATKTRTSDTCPFYFSPLSPFGTARTKTVRYKQARCLQTTTSVRRSILLERFIINGIAFFFFFNFFFSRKSPSQIVYVYIILFTIGIVLCKQYYYRFIIIIRTRRKPLSPRIYMHACKWVH